MSQPAKQIEEAIKSGKEINEELMNEFFNSFNPVIDSEKITIGATVTEVLMGRCPPIVED